MPLVAKLSSSVSSSASTLISAPLTIRGRSPTSRCTSLHSAASAVPSRLGHIWWRWCGVAMTVSTPSAADAKHIATASAIVAGPSSMPGSTWLWVSIMPAPLSPRSAGSSAPARG